MSLKHAIKPRDETSQVSERCWS